MMSVPNYFRIMMFIVLPILCLSEEAFTKSNEPQPDLWGYGFYVTFKEGGAKFKGYSYTVNYRFINWGTRGLTYNDIFDVKFYLTAKPTSLTSYNAYLGADTLSILLGSTGTTEILSKKIIIPDSLSLSETQFFYLTIVLNASQLMDESNVENNILSSSNPYAISEPPQGADLCGEDLLFKDSYYRYKGNLYEINYAIWNQGNTDFQQGSNLKIRFYLSLNNLISPLDIPIGEITFDDFIRKQSRIENLETAVTIPEGIDDGAYYLGMFIDKDEATVDIDRSNNTYLSDNKYFVIERESEAPYYMHANEMGTGYNLAMTNVMSSNRDISAGDEIGVYDGLTCVGAGVITGIWPLKIKAWQDDPQTGEKDGYEPGNTIDYYYWDSSQKMEFLMRAAYLRGDTVFNSEDPSALGLIDAGKLILIDGEKIRTTIINDTSHIAAGFRSGEGVSIRFNSEGITGKVFSITQSTRPFDEIAPSQSFSNPVYYIRPEIAIRDYEAVISFEYTDTFLQENEIQEIDLIIASWNSGNESWVQIPSQLDTVQNTLTISVTEFPIFALISSTETLISGVEYGVDAALPLRFFLYPNYPNPFNPVTTIRYELARYSGVTIKIFNMLGQEVKTLVSSHLVGGAHEVVWDGTNNLGQAVSTGVYICRMITSEGFVDSKKMLLLQ